MKTSLLIICLLLFQITIAAKESTDYFHQSKVSSSKGLVLYSTELFIKSEEVVQQKHIRRAFKKWQNKKVRGRSKDQQNIIAVYNEKNGHSGSLWTLKDKKVKRLNEWSLKELSYTPYQPKDRLFGFLGGQTSFGDANSIGLTSRIGTTLFKNQYDLAISFSYFKYSPEDAGDAYTSKTLGLVGRALYPWKESLGWNVGAQIIYQDPAVVENKIVPGALIGINYYLEGGTLDTTVTYNADGDMAFLTGYTFFLTL